MRGQSGQGVRMSTALAEVTGELLQSCWTRHSSKKTALEELMGLVGGGANNPLGEEAAGES